MCAEVAQSVEQGTENPRVGGSIPSLGTNKIKGLAVMPLTPSFFGCGFGGLYRSLPVPKSPPYADSESNVNRLPDKIRMHHDACNQRQPKPRYRYVTEVTPLLFFFLQTPPKTRIF